MFRVKTVKSSRCDRLADNRKYYAKVAFVSIRSKVRKSPSHPLFLYLSFPHPLIPYSRSSDFDIFFEIQCASCVFGLVLQSLD
jgi:hypothetical protein